MRDKSIRALRLLPVGVALVALGALGCSTDKLLQVTDPDVARPSALAGAANLPALRAGAIGDFGNAFDGGNADVEQVHLAGMLGDELLNTETFPTRIEIDQRAQTLTNTSLIGTFLDLARARTSADRAAAGYQQFAKLASDSTGYPEVLALSGLAYVLFAENYCGAVPASTQLPDGTLVFGKPQSTKEMLDSAISKFNQALAVKGSPLTATFKALAQVGKGRALLDEGDFVNAAAAVAGVPTTFQYIYAHSETSGRQNNGTWALTSSVARFGVANIEGGNGLPFQSEGSSKVAGFDPRVADSVRAGSGKGFDGSTIQWVQEKYPVRSSLSVIADGVEARLIEAEAALQGGDAAGALTILNALRSNSALIALRGYGIGSAPTPPQAAPALPPLTLQTTTAAQVSQLFKERAYWLFLTAHRLGDMRRLIRQYSRGAETVFPTGAYFKGGTYGTDVNSPVPQAEQNNPNFTPAACVQSQP